MHENYNNGFSGKNHFWGKWGILDTKMAHPHNCGFTLRIAFKFCKIKGVKRYIKSYLWFFQKKNCSGQMGYFGWGNWVILDPEMMCPYYSGSFLRVFKKYCSMKGAKKLVKVLLMVFSQKNLVHFLNIGRHQ